MRRPYLSVLPAPLFVATVVLEVAAITLSWRLEPSWDTVLYAVYSITMAGAGALIATRHPRNAIGWLFLGFALFNALIADAFQGWALRAAAAGWPGVAVAEWITTLNWLPAGFGTIMTFLLFPDGHLRSNRWRFVAWAGAVGTALALPGWGLSPTIGPEFSGGRNPFALPSLPTGTLLALGMPLFLGALALSVLSLGLRLRGSAGVERQQLKWVAFAGTMAALVLPFVFVFWSSAPIVRPLAALVLTGLPLAVGVAILRYRLYDIDLVISRTVLYGTLTVLLALAYGASVLLIGTAVGRGSAWATAGGTLVVALAFRPLLDRLRRHVERRFSRARYDARHHVRRFLEDLRDGRAAAEDIETVLREALGDPSLELRFTLPETGLLETGGLVDARGRPVIDTPGDGRERWPVRRGGTTLGEVVREPGSLQQRALLPEVIDAAGLGVEIARLRVELRRQLDEVAASRRRIVAAAEQERRRIERDLHDGAQQRLVAIGLALRHAQHELGPDRVPAASRTLDGAVAEIAVAIDELRELARGVGPAQLEAGLGVALRDLADRAPLPVEVTVTGQRFTPELEAAAYFIACEGLTNAVKHARATNVTLEVARSDGKLLVRVADDGVGGAVAGRGSGLTGLSDRVAAQGGRLEIHSGAGAGTRLTAELPCAS